MKNKILIPVLFLLAFSYNLPAEENVPPGLSKHYKIIGLVKKSSNKPFPFAYVSVKNYAKIKTATNFDGTFQLNIPDSIKFPITLEFYSVGYVAKKYEVTAKNKSKKIQITLAQNKAKAITKKSNSKSTSKAKKTTSLLLEESEAAAGGFGEVSAAAEVKGRVVGNIDIEFGSTEPLIVPAEPQNAAAGMLTAGELNDFSKWTLWEDIAKNQLELHQKEWKILPAERYVAQLTNPDKMPIVDALVSLKDKNQNTIWQTRTDNTGKAELWARMLSDGVQNAGEPYSLVFSYKGKTTEIEALPFPKRINSAELKVNCNEKKQVDVQFIVDATGSMGDEIKYLQAELYDVIEKVKENNANLQLRIGSVFYRDSSDDYVTIKTPLDKNTDKTVSFIKQQSAEAGGDFPEAVDAALTEAIENENWSENALSRVAFLILDAPPHNDTNSIARIHRQVRLAAMKGIRIVPLVCSGADKTTEYLMRSIALATNGTYVFLTDESGIGETHIKPTTDKYEVEKLNHILLRIITEFSTIPNCNNNWAADFDAEINSQEKFIPKPYKENPAEDSERLTLADIINIYPNPCHGELNINLLQSDLDLYLVDVTGKSLENVTSAEPTLLTFDLSTYSAGMYFINAFYEGRWYTLKFLLTK